MYIKSVEIKNIRSIAHAKWELDEGEYAGWHVLIGDNGSGKTTILKSVGLALIGSTSEAERLAQDWSEWLAVNITEGNIALEAELDNKLDRIEPIQRQQSLPGFFDDAGKVITIKIARELPTGIIYGLEDVYEMGLTELQDEDEQSDEYKEMEDELKRYRESLDKLKRELVHYSWDEYFEKLQDLEYEYDVGLEDWINEYDVPYTDIQFNQPFRRIKGYFSAAYGPFRRFMGDSGESDEIFKSSRALGAHLSVFGENYALTEIKSWLEDLNYKRLEGKPEGDLLELVKTFINQPDFLPHDVKLTEVSSDGVFFTDANGNQITVDNLSDGYRSILSMTLEIIRQMQIAYRTTDLFTEDGTQVKMPGVVLIDEVDAHLHPTWQRRIGQWFTQHFPAVQFIVTTHSPLVCQAAVKGSVWRLPTPGTDEKLKRVAGQDLDRLLYGDILEAYSTQLFGLTNTRSDEGKDMLERLATLNIKEMFEDLTEQEQQEQERLRAMLPINAGIARVSDD